MIRYHMISSGDVQNSKLLFTSSLAVPDDYISTASAMDTSISLEGLLSVVHSAALDRPCSDDHLMELALGLTNWKEMAYFLKLSETEIEEVEAGVRDELVRAKNLRMLRKWKAKYGKQATYR